MINQLEQETAENLVLYASDVVTNFYEEGDWDAGIVAVLARSMEIATGRTLKPLDEIFQFQEKHDGRLQ